MSIAWKPVLKTSVSILFGFALGVAGTHWYWGKSFGGHWKHPRDPKAFAERFKRKLDLDDEQASKLESIFAAKHKRMEEMRQEIFPKFEAIRSEVHGEIRAVLKPDQQIKFEELRKKREARRKKRFGPWRRHWGGGAWRHNDQEHNSREKSPSD